jgi:hypothetical protein
VNTLHKGDDDDDDDDIIVSFLLLVWWHNNQKAEYRDSIGNMKIQPLENYKGRHIQRYNKNKLHLLYLLK